MSGPPDRIDVASFVHSKERRYFIISAVVSVCILVPLGMAVLTNAALRPMAFLYLVLGIVSFTLMHGLLIGHLRGNAVRVSAHQFPLLHRLLVAHARRLQMTAVPDAFVLQSGGVINAFATRFLGHDFVVINSDVLELAMIEGEEVVSFILAHELGHVARHHMTRRMLVLPSRFLPFLGAAYSRACEYTADRLGAECAPAGAVQGLLVLASGKALYRQVDARIFARQSVTEGGFWTRFAELLATHPTLPKRVEALMSAGITVPVAVHAGAGAERLSVAGESLAAPALTP